MNKFYSNSFDDSVKSAFEKADNELNNSGNWDAMQQLLDQQLPVARKKRRFFFWFFIAALLVGGFLAFQLWKNNTYDKNVEISLDNKPVQNLKESQTSKDNQIPKENSIPAENKNLIETQITNEESVLKYPTVKLNRFNPLEKIGFQAKNQEQKNKFSDRGKSEAAIEKSNISNKTQEEIITNIGIDKENLGDIQPKLTASNSNCVAVKPVVSDSIVSISDTASQPEQSITKQRMQTKWHWNLSFAPDFLLANIQPLYRPGVSLGLGINYQLSPKWAIRTGLLYNYTAVYESGQTYVFKPSPNLPTYNTIELKQVKGSLHVFEVPLSARYTANPDKKVSFLGSIGLSSLFFVKQKLTYDLLLNGNMPLSWNSENDSDDFGESHILSNLVLGTGISIKTKKNTVIEVEPVFKLPLEELGEGHNKLGTIAIYLHLKQPIFKQKK